MSFNTKYSHKVTVQGPILEGIFRDFARAAFESGENKLFVT